jgi:hypothetical protein
MRFTTLIPAYKPQYLLELMTCLHYQTVKPARVIVSDDSPEQTFTQLLESEPLKTQLIDLNIQVIKGPQRGGYNNFRHLFRYFSSQQDPTELFHVLLDDDLIYPTFYEQHLKAHQLGTTACVVSRRWACNQRGQPIKDDLVVPALINEHPQRVLTVNADGLFTSAVAAGRNWLGEFSNATFHRSMAPELVDVRIGGMTCEGLEDLLAFVKASLRAPVGYINAHLGAFRQSDGQNSAQPMGRPMKLAFTAYVAMVMAGRDLGRLDLKSAREAIQRIGGYVLLYYGEQPDMQYICNALRRLVQSDWEAESEFAEAWRMFAGDPLGQSAPAQ